MAATIFALAAVLLFGACVSASPVELVPKSVAEEARMTTPELLTKYEYPVETHTVQTEDGYILTLHRVPYGKESPAVEGVKRPPILVQHGLLSSSADWVVMGPGIGYAYILADAGYDVWLGNVRGNTYSKKHATLSVNSHKFWDFSWHEQGIYDLPATIDYILEQTGEENLFYSGHSMGTTMFYVMASQKPEYNAKIRAMFSLAPIAFMNHMTSPFFKFISLFNKPMELLMGLLGIDEFLPNNELMTLVGQQLCKDGAITQGICSNVLFLIAGYDSQELNDTMLPSIIAHTPAGASTKQMLHYAQGINSGHFRQYDYGMVKNLIVYGHISPPDYDLGKITAPVYLHYGPNDWLAGLTDVDRLYTGLGNAAGKIRVTLDAFNHLDFLWAIHGKNLVYDKTIDYMKTL